MSPLVAGQATAVKGVIVNETILFTVGREIRDARLRAGMSQESLGSFFGWGKDAISKIERGVTKGLSLADYLRIVDILATHMPLGHPAVALVVHFKNPPGAAGNYLD